MMVTSSRRNQRSHHGPALGAPLSPSRCAMCHHSPRHTTSPCGHRLPHPPWKTELALPGSVHTTELPEAATNTLGTAKAQRAAGKGWI